MKEPHVSSTVLRDARIVLLGKIAERASLLIHDGRIAALIESTRADPPIAESTIDLSGLTIFPGFIDVHIHGAVGVDTLDAEPQDLERVSQFLATRGVTGWLPTLVPAATAGYARAVKSIEAAMKTQAATRSEAGARILGVHYEGPFVNSAQCGALRGRFFRSYSSASDISDLPVLDQQFAKHMITVAPEIAGGVDLVRELCSRGWIVSLGHTRADFQTLDNAFAAGARHMTHFMNAMPTLHHRSPGPVGWGLLREEVSCDVIADGVHLDPHMLQLLHKLKGTERLMLISDAIAAAGKGDGDYEIWEETITVKDGRTRNANGSIAGAVITMLEAVQLMKSLGVAEVDLARMSATNPARLLGIDQECGSIAEGKRADLVALDDEGQVVLTVIGGSIVFDAREKQSDE